MPETVSEIEVTVAVPVKDRREQMLRCLDALLAQDHPSYEILVLDNESGDGTPEACRERAAQSNVPIRVEVVPGTVGHVRNRAGELARGRFIAFTDSDCLPAPEWLSHGVAAFAADPQVGIVCGCTLPEEEIVRSWPATIEVREFTKRFESCNLLFRTDALRGSDGFDETVGHYWEDTAAGFAVLRNGWRAAFARDAVVYHDVTYPGFHWQIRRAQKNAHLGPVLRNYPEVRRELLYGRIFLNQRNAEFVAFATGIALARRRWWTLLLCLPYLRSREFGRHPPKNFVMAMLYDGSVVIGLLRASWRARRLVI
jgi:cellulose synthase/poly-beta-1,6-N-acetylglucosamine synthase-like glycosyltransferase